MIPASAFHGPHYSHHPPVYKAERLLGYAPKVSPAEGIARTAQWYRHAGYLGGGQVVPNASSVR